MLLFALYISSLLTLSLGQVLISNRSLVTAGILQWTESEYSVRSFGYIRIVFIELYTPFSLTVVKWCGTIFYFCSHWRRYFHIIMGAAQRKRGTMLYFANVFIYLFIFYGRLILRPWWTEVRESFTRGGPWVSLEKLLLGFFPGHP